MYVPFLMAEMMDLSGIVTILFTGMTARAYVVPNISTETAHQANTFFRLAAHLAETSIFLELGLSVFGMKGSVHVTFIAGSLVACFIGRALNVYPLVYLYNHYFRQPQRQRRHGSQHHHHLHPRNTRIRDSSSSSRMNRNVNHHHHHNSSSTPPHGESSSDEVELTTMTSRSHDSMDSATSPYSISLDGPEDSHDSSGGGEIRSSPFRGMVQHDLDISTATAHMLWFSGLRGAVAYACVRSFPNTFHHAQIFTVTTMCIVLITVFGLGSTTELALNWLGIEMNIDEGLYMEAWHQEQSEDGLLIRIQDQLKHYAVRSSTPIAVHILDDQDDDLHLHHGSGGGTTTMAPGEASIASGYRHHQENDDDDHDDNNDDSEEDGHPMVDDGGGGTVILPHRSAHRRESVYDYGNR
jgi:hypothetical protein